MARLDYKVYYNNDGLPDKIVWMLLETRYNILQYGDTVFLAFQKRQFNKIYWHYIGPAIENNENKIIITSELVVST